MDSGAYVTCSAAATQLVNALDHASYRALLLADPARARHSAMVARGRELDAELRPSTADTLALESMFNALHRAELGHGRGNGR